MHTVSTAGRGKAWHTQENDDKNKNKGARSFWSIKPFPALLTPSLKRLITRPCPFSACTCFQIPSPPLKQSIESFFTTDSQEYKEPWVIKVSPWCRNFNLLAAGKHHWWVNKESMQGPWQPLPSAGQDSTLIYLLLFIKKQKNMFVLPQ